jgi:hypothetical protein
MLSHARRSHTRNQTPKGLAWAWDTDRRDWYPLGCLGDINQHANGGGEQHDGSARARHSRAETNSKSNNDATYGSKQTTRADRNANKYLLGKATAAALIWGLVGCVPYNSMYNAPGEYKREKVYYPTSTKDNYDEELRRIQREIRWLREYIRQP